VSDPLTIDHSTVIWSVPEPQRAGRPLLLLLHGKGSHEGDLAGLIDRLPSDFVVASLRAPIAEGPGFSWWVGEVPSNPSAAGVGLAVDAVLAWLDELPFTPPSLGVLGFSQGGVMALQLLRTAPERVGFALNLSGYSVDGELPHDGELTEHPVFWGRGDADVVIASSAIERTARWLPAHVELTAASYRGVTHTISSEELDDIHAFLTARR